ncbi:hypothetical protein INT44_003561 [Umbelopsis vinacea]|uniref:Amino acid transporter n=1 Tax=Umbelopsis vinacea TaxID=44442 RepID=A0A8H7PUI6_9FUNG|nr:hypothetical protein INT44_003561 [Umbelopsis vinacea]
MDEKTASEGIQTTDDAPANVNVEHIESNDLDYDAQRLHDLGYKQEFKRSLDMFVQFGFAFSTMAVLPSWSVGFGPSLNSGGPVALFFGWIIVATFVSLIGLGMAEIVSAMPTAGGVYYWCFKLADQNWGPFAAWMAGYTYLVGLLAVNMTLAYGGAQFIIGMIAMGEGTYPQGAYVGIYVGLLILAALVNLLGTGATGIINKFIVAWALIGTVIIVIAMPAMAPTHQPAQWVFTEFINNTGYTNSGIVFFLGMLQAGWTLIGYETSAQIVEETYRADIAAPRGIIVSIVGAWIQGLVLILAVLFSIQDVDDIMTSTVPIARLFYSTTNNNGLTIFFLLILLGAQLGSLFNSILACAHLIWAMARDGCLPYSKFFYKLSDKTHAPVRAIWLQLVICIVIIMPSFGSTVFWQAIMSTAVIAVNISYGLPFFCRLVFSRNTMEKGPFNLGKWSLPINAVSLIWISFFAVILCFPAVSPVSPVSMNYASLMIGAVLLFALFFWIVSGRHFYKGPMQNADN